jgi:hypothetical protein
METLYDSSIEQVIANIPDDIKRRLLDKLIEENQDYVASRITDSNAIVNSIRKYNISQIESILFSSWSDCYEYIIHERMPQLMNRFNLYGRTDVYSISVTNVKPCSCIITKDEYLKHELDKISMERNSIRNMYWYLHNLGYKPIAELERLNI